MPTETVANHERGGIVRRCAAPSALSVTSWPFAIGSNEVKHVLTIQRREKLRRIPEPLAKLKGTRKADPVSGAAQPLSRSVPPNALEDRVPTETRSGVSGKAPRSDKARVNGARASTIAERRMARWAALPSTQAPLDKTRFGAVMRQQLGPRLAYVRNRSAKPLRDARMEFLPSYATGWRTRRPGPARA